MSSAYLIAHVEVTDPQRYADYQKLSSIAIQAAGAEICARGGAVSVLEGDWRPARVVVLKFPDVAAAHAFWNSSEYLQAREARMGAAVMRMIVVEGV